ncbi:tetratricopeptide repeat protein 5 [Dendroctonus ponderosae]|uniref:Tetratricopeptide repeat protein 5 OB fold domain-containing protein n=1 Tax=Dendroctonus ponderosae TaxID=77166 RepID=U4UDF4_DENPD|nr:tetratricopeptide repeat protein 5 [Dendroctonus ponderosae]ERL92004.1 hypothetical protein D910_09326 [Dendroctonus ponderosae]KAH1026837.1 hypothetical protein HUJ05_000450 [Dendroctonus ponderosae]
MIPAASMSLEATNQSCDCGEPHEDLIQFLENLVNELGFFKDRYILNYGIENAANQSRDLDRQMDEKLEIFLKHQSAALEMNKPYYYYLKGKLLNISTTYSSEAESLLSKAIKLDPKIVDAWNELGESYFKANEFAKAQSCFEGGLREKRNKVSLRNLATILRRAQTETADSLKKRIELITCYSKEALKMDPQDGKSWLNWGTAQLYIFFGTTQSPYTIKQCLSAYAQAEKDINCKTSVELHYNKGIIFKYQELYKQALESLETAALYDPMWEDPKVQGAQLLQYLQNIVELIRTKGKLKPKKLLQILKTINSKYLGPYSAAGQCGETTTALHNVPYNELQPGSNVGKVILGTVICSVVTESGVPFTFCSIDKSETIIVTTLYNLAAGKGVIIGDRVAIPQPLVTDIDFHYKDNHFKFRTVRVQNPMQMIVNGKQVDDKVVSNASLCVLDH